MSDVQNRIIDGGFKLTRVGVKGVKKPIHISRPGRSVTLTAEIDVFVDLPAIQKGSHMSRNLEAINEILDQSVREPRNDLESLCQVICTLLLEKHEYATYSEVSMRADYFLEKEFLNKKSLENYRLLARAFSRKRDAIESKKSIGVEVVGMTACPCAMETVKDALVEKYAEHKEAIRSVPTITHNQRNVSSLIIEVPNEFEVEADKLIEIVENSLSSPTYEILKREDEREVVITAHANPKFVEDVVRDILRQVLEEYADLPDDVVIIAKSESEESIHKHNAFAERATTLGELRE